MLLQCRSRSRWGARVVIRRIANIVRTHYIMDEHTLGATRIRLHDALTSVQSVVGKRIWARETRHISGAVYIRDEMLKPDGAVPTRSLHDVDVAEHRWVEGDPLCSSPLREACREMPIIRLVDFEAEHPAIDHFIVPFFIVIATSNRGHHPPAPATEPNPRCHTRQSMRLGAVDGPIECLSLRLQLTYRIYFARERLHMLATQGVFCV